MATIGPSMPSKMVPFPCLPLESATMLPMIPPSAQMFPIPRRARAEMRYGVNPPVIVTLSISTACEGAEGSTLSTRSILFASMIVARAPVPTIFRLLATLRSPLWLSSLPLGAIERT